MAVVALALWDPPRVLLRMTPAIRTAGSNAIKPLTIAAELRVMLWAETTRMTGRSSVFAIAAVLPVSFSASAPVLENIPDLPIRKCEAVKVPAGAAGDCRQVRRVDVVHAYLEGLDPV